MANMYGVNLTQTDMAKALANMERQQNGVKTWDQYFGAASLGYQKEQSALTGDLSEAMNQAYQSYLGQQNIVKDSGLSLGQQERLRDLSAKELSNTYNTYLANYQSAINDLTKTYSSNVNAIEEALNTEATNYLSLVNSAYDYLSEELYNATDKSGTSLLTNRGLSKYLYTAEDAEKGLGTEGELMSWNDIKEKLFTEEGNLTPEGVEFFDIVYNMQPQSYYIDDKYARSFGQWLSDKDIANKTNLYEFYTSADPFNYSFAGNRAGTLNVLLGRESTDIKYDESEYYKKYYEDVENLENDIGNIDKDISSYQTKINNVKNDNYNYKVYHHAHGRTTRKLKADAVEKINDYEAKIRELKIKRDESLSNLNTLKSDKEKHREPAIPSGY